MKKQLALFMAYAVVASTAQAFVTNVFQIGGDSGVRDGGWSGTVVTNSAVSPVEYSMSFGAPAKYEELGNVVFTVTAVADNPADMLVITPTFLAVDSSARQTDEYPTRINLDESITLTFSYEDPDNKLSALKMDAIGVYYAAGAAEELLFTDGSAVYAIMAGANSALFDYDTTGLLQLTLSNTDTWSMKVYQVNNVTSGTMGAFKIEYIADTDFIPEPVDPPYGEVEFSESWEFTSSTSNMAVLAQSSDGFSVAMTNSTAKRFITKMGENSFNAPFQVGEIATWSFTAAVGQDLGLNPGDKFFQGSLWDADITDGSDNGVTFQVDWGTPDGETMYLGSSKVTGLSKIGATFGTVSTTDVPGNALDAVGAAADFVVSIERTTETNIALSLTYDDVTLTNTRVVPASFDSLNELGFRFKQSDDNALVISNMTLVITSSNFDYYNDWASTKGLDASNNAPGLDPDEDGMDNLLEYALGGNPLVDDAATILPTESANGGFFNLIYARRVDADARGLDYKVSSSLDLVYGPITNATEEVGSVVIDSEFESVTNRVPLSSGAKQFMQLKVSK